MNTGFKNTISLNVKTSIFILTLFISGLLKYYIYFIIRLGSKQWGIPFAKVDQNHRSEELLNKDQHVYLVASE